MALPPTEAILEQIFAWSDLLILTLYLPHFCAPEWGWRSCPWSWLCTWRGSSTWTSCTATPSCPTGWCSPWSWGSSTPRGMPPTPTGCTTWWPWWCTVAGTSAHPLPLLAVLRESLIPLQVYSTAWESRSAGRAAWLEVFWLFLKKVCAFY